MQITFACGAMAFGPETPSRVSLGGSETAALMLAKATAALGNDVTIFCNLPPEGRPDYYPSGQKHTDGVRYVDLKHYQGFVTVNPCDLLIVVRDPQLIALPAQAKKKVLWMHDIATKRGMQRVLEQMAFTFDEIWSVSEWHKEQIAETTGYPRNRIVALRNGIVKYDDILPVDKEQKLLIYASRPERGLENLVKPGGIMERLPDYKLIVCMYEHFPEHMKDFYAYIFDCIKRLPNVEYVGGKPNRELRQMIRMAAAYIYPTQFEETSCILARECIEQQTPFITTSVGALPETLGTEGIFFEDYLYSIGITEPERGSPGWCMLFAQFFRDAISRTGGLSVLKNQMAQRQDLYWDGVAKMAEPHFERQPVTPFSRLYSLIQNGDVIPAKAYYQSIDVDTPLLGDIAAELELYNFITKPVEEIAAYYDHAYTSKPENMSELQFQCNPDTVSDRHNAIYAELSKLAPGSKVLEYGCGAGHIIGPAAQKFPLLTFLGFDHAKSAVGVINKGAREAGLTNLSAVSVEPEENDFDAVICSEVLEHVLEPWKLLQTVESHVKLGSPVLLTVPFGPWEPLSFETPGRWDDRAHLWEIDRQMFAEMTDGLKPGERVFLSVAGNSPWMTPIGNILFFYEADHRPIKAVDPLAKALRAQAHETCAAAIIAYNNEDTIVRLLNSLENKVQYFQIALGPCSDHTETILMEWFEARPWVRFNIIDAPLIEPYKFGFDDARNLSTTNLCKDCEWFLWVDTDEYVSGDFRKYLRSSSIDGYLISQHHFTVEPRGNPPEIDKPARLCRTDRGYVAKGHIHEHFEVPEGGPGRCMMLADIDIGHPGYVNEETRKARFFRNFPFLAWEHEEGGDRKLHKFLWFRDIIHRMRFIEDPAGKHKLAQEAVSYYNDNQAEMSTFGPGLFMALKYLAEANTMLNRGVPLRVTIQLDDRNATLEGRFDSYAQVENVVKQLLVDEFKDRTNRYY